MEDIKLQSLFVDFPDNLTVFDILGQYEVIRKHDIVYGPRLNLPIDRRGLGAFLFDSFKKHGDKVFQVDSITGETETYRNFNRRCIRTAVEMRKRGIKKDDVIVLCSRNNKDIFIPIVSALYLDAKCASLDPNLSLRDVVHLLNTVQPKMIISEMGSLILIEDALKQLPFKVDVVVLGFHSKYAMFSDFLLPDEQENSFKPVVVKDDKETAMIFFSSGSSGLPKAICCSHYGLLYVSTSKAKAGINAEVSLHFSSFYWISAFFTTMLIVLKGGRKIICPPFEPHMAMKVFQDYKVTFAFMASNCAYKFTKENTAPYDTSSLETVTFGGNPIGIDQIKKCRSYFPHSFVSIGYGMTEVSGYISIFLKQYHEHLASTKLNSCGVPAADIQIKIVDPDTEKLLGPNEKGEIRILSDTLLTGYYNGDTSDIFDSDSYLKTGDIGYFDEDNCLYVCDRIKDMFRYESWNIVPASIETVIYQHPAVQEAVVIGTPHTEDNHLPMALVVLKENYSNVNEEEIKSFVNERVLDREQLRAGLKIVADLPKTPSGKLIRRRIRDMVLKGQI